MTTHTATSRTGQTLTINRTKAPEFVAIRVDHENDNAEAIVAAGTAKTAQAKVTEYARATWATVYVAPVN